jgi:hypothetical protein
MWHGIIPYDPVSKDIKAMIDESVYEFYVNDEYYFYYSKTGFYCHNKLSGEKQRIADSAFEIIEHDRIIYFIDYKNEDIINPGDEHNIIGKEKWITLYRYDIEQKV